MSEYPSGVDYPMAVEQLESARREALEAVNVLDELVAIQKAGGSVDKLDWAKAVAAVRNRSQKVERRQRTADELHRRGVQ